MSGVAERTNPQDEMIWLTDRLLTEWRHHSRGSTVWFSYFEGNLSVKNPDDECLAKMKQIAAKLQAHLQGDDGELYEKEGFPPRQPTLSFRERMRIWLQHLRPHRRVKIEHRSPPFQVGDRVRDAWGKQHTVIAIDAQAEHGLGVIRTRGDDGTEQAWSIIAHGLEPVTHKG